MQTIEIKTLIDITETRVIRPNQGTPQQLDQQRNFTTLRQCLELRSIIEYDYPPSHETVDIKDMGFGKNFKGKHTVWTFRFRPDRAYAYGNDTDTAAGQLVEDLHEVPVIKNLTETVNIDKAIFDCQDINNKNIIIKASLG